VPGILHISSTRVEQHGDASRNQGVEHGASCRGVSDGLHAEVRGEEGLRDEGGDLAFVLDAFHEATGCVGCGVAALLDKSTADVGGAGTLLADESDEAGAVLGSDVAEPSGDVGGGLRVEEGGVRDADVVVRPRVALD